MILESALPTETPSRGEEPRGALRSPGLNRFGRNPFRVLRLPASASSKQAVWKADKVLALARVGMPLSGVEPLPWLPAADELEIQQAAQAMEEPLRRLIEQLLWFDFEVDPRGEILQGALRGDDPAALKAALSARGTDPLAAPAGATPPDASLASERIAAVARWINDANLRLLLGLAALHGVGPRPPVEATPQKAGVTKRPEIQWQEGGGLRFVENPHALIRRSSKSASALAFEGLLREGLAGWAQILKDGSFEGYLRHQIAKLEDDLVGGDDIEPITRAVRAELAAIIADEMKLFTLDGRMDRTFVLARVATKSGIEPEVWIHSFRPLRHLFRAELDELGGLVDESAPANLENIELYLKRLGALVKRWKGLDTSGVLGLAQMLDEGVSRAFERLRSLQGEGALADQIARIEPIQQALVAAHAVARSKSLKERLGAYSERLEGTRKHACHFCRLREASEYPVVLVSKKETSRESNYLTNTVTIHYEIRRQIVQRCEPCADGHEFIRSVGISIAVVIAAIYIMWLLLLSASHNEAVPLFLANLIPIGMVAFMLRWIALAIIRRLLIPRGHKYSTDVRGSAGYAEIRHHGDSISIKTAKYALRNETGS
jgi:hypothetical protein